VAVNQQQVGRLDNLYDRGLKNEVPDLKIVGPDEIRDIEPNCVVNTMLDTSLSLVVSLDILVHRETWQISVYSLTTKLLLRFLVI